MRRDLLTSTLWTIRPELIAAARAELIAGRFGLLRARNLDEILATDLTEPSIVSAERETVPTGQTAEGWETRAAGEISAKIAPATERAAARKAGSVAVIPCRGTISNRVTFFDLLFGSGVTPPGWIVQQVKQAVDDDGIKAVVMDWDSPGGVHTQCPEAAAAILAMRGPKPIISQVSGQMCSAAYWIGSAADEIDAAESAIVGSIGCYLEHDDFSKMYEDVGLKVTYIASTPEKVEGNDAEPLSDEARAHMQEMVDDVYAMFVDAVAAGRGVGADVVRGESYGRGRAYTGPRAVKRGLADKVRSLPDTLAAYGVNPSAPDPMAARGRGMALLRREIDALEL